MSVSRGRGPLFESLLLISTNLETGRRGYEFELARNEYGAIGYVVVHWAFLEFALHERTKAFARRAKVTLPKQAHSFSFTRRLTALRELMLACITDKNAIKRWEKLISRIARAEGRRHRIAHGLWSYNPRRVERLWAHDRRTKHSYAAGFDVTSLGEFGASVGALSFDLLHPRPGSGRRPKESGLPVAYASRRFRLMLEGRDLDSPDFPEPIPVKPTPPQAPSEE